MIRAQIESCKALPQSCPEGSPRQLIALLLLLMLMLDLSHSIRLGARA